MWEKSPFSHGIMLETYRDQQLLRDLLHFADAKSQVQDDDVEPAHCGRFQCVLRGVSGFGDSELLTRSSTSHVKGPDSLSLGWGAGAEYPLRPPSGSFSPPTTLFPARVLRVSASKQDFATTPESYAIISVNFSFLPH